MIVSILAWIIIGGIAGWLASKVMNTDASQGTVQDIVVGIVGAFVGGFVLNILGVASADGEFSVLSLVTAFVGSVVLLGVLKLIRR